MTCCQCQGIESEFNHRLAQRELRRYRRRGPVRSTRLLLEVLKPALTPNSTLLDIGGGVGAIHHELLDAGAVSAVHVDASSSYLDAAREESTRRHHLEAVEFVQGDFVTLAPELAPVEIVTLDRVICCYPDMPALVAAAADKAQRVFGAVYPPNTWWMRITVRCLNWFLGLRQSNFRVFVHPTDAIEAVLREHGLVRATHKRTLVWEIATFTRSRPV